MAVRAGTAMVVQFKDQNPTKQEELERKTDTGGIIWASELERTTESSNPNGTSSSQIFVSSLDI